MKLKVVLMEEAAAFIAGQSVKAQQKIYYNIFKVEEGIREAEIFKKLENTDIVTGFSPFGIQIRTRW